jgi:hypothetical protein
MVSALAQIVAKTKMGMHGRLALSVHSHFDLTKILEKWFSCNEGFVIGMLE